MRITLALLLVPLVEVRLPSEAAASGDFAREAGRAAVAAGEVCLGAGRAGLAREFAGLAEALAGRVADEAEASALRESAAALDTCAAAAGPPRPPATTFALENGRLALPGPVAFRPGTDRLAPEAAAALFHVLDFLAAKPDVTLLRIEGHVAGTGDTAAGQARSEARALAAARWLVRHGADPKRLLPVGFGDTKPAAAADTPAGRAANTRLEFALAALRGRAIGGLPADGGGSVAGDPAAAPPAEAGFAPPSAEVAAEIEALRAAARDRLAADFPGDALSGTVADLLLLARAARTSWAAEDGTARFGLGLLLADVLAARLGGRLEVRAEESGVRIAVALDGRHADVPAAVATDLGPDYDVFVAFAAFAEDLLDAR